MNDKKWWEYLEQYEIEKLEEYYPNYKKLKRPNLDIRWKLDEWSMENAVQEDRMTLEQPKLTKEEIREILRKQKLYYQKYGNYRMPDDWNGE